MQVRLVAGFVSAVLGASAPEVAAQHPGSEAVPFVETAMLSAPGVTYHDRFGATVACDGDTIVVGSPLTTVGANNWQGAVYVFEKGPSGWVDPILVAELTVSDGKFNDRFGLTVAFDGNTIAAVGMASATVFLFEKPVGGWASGNESARLRHPRNSSTPSLAVAPDAVFVGLPDGLGAFTAGVVLAYSKPPGGWHAAASDAVRLVGPAAGPADFGTAIAIHDDTLVVSAPAETPKGAVYVFEKPATGWRIAVPAVARLTTSVVSALGYAVAVSDDTIIATDRNRPLIFPMVGAAFVFAKPASGWVNATETATLVPSVVNGGDGFGNSVAIDGDLIVVGKMNEIINGQFARGSAYVYVRPSSGWTSGLETQMLLASNGARTDFFGASVAIAGSTVAVGAPRGVGRPGLGYVFEDSAGTAQATRPMRELSDVVWLASPVRRPSPMPAWIEHVVGDAFNSLLPIDASPIGHAWYWHAVRDDAARLGPAEVSEVRTVQPD